MYLLETSFLIDLIRERNKHDQPAHRVLNSLPSNAQLAVSSITVAELAVGEYLAKTDAGKKRNRKFRNWICAVCEVNPFHLDEAMYFAKITVLLRSLGKPIPFGDIQIAATALAGKQVLITRDRHYFDPLTEIGLQILSYDN
jgi:predicted nucleic acid-binding protein